MQKTLSVAIPAYNAEAYLDKCIPSLLVPQVLDRLEILIVNDGSTDSTGDIANRYAARWPHSVTVIHKENGGHGSVINRAAEMAAGIFFRVLDADDWLISNHLAQHLEELEGTSADVVINPFHRVDMRTGKRIPVEFSPDFSGKTLSLEEMNPHLRAIRNCFTIHGMTYRLSSYRASSVKLSEKIFYEDNEFTTLPFSEVKSVYFSPHFLYQYQVNNQNQSTANQNMLKRLSHLEQVLWRIADFDRSAEAYSPAARSYIDEKMRTLIAAYLSASLLRDPNRKIGRTRAASFMQSLRAKRPSLASDAAGQYKRFLRLHRIGLRGDTYDSLLDSAVYREIRKRIRETAGRQHAKNQ